MALPFRLSKNDHAIVKRSGEQSGDDRLSIAFAMFANSNKFLPKVRRNRLIIVDEQTDRTIQRDLNQIFDLKRTWKSSLEERRRIYLIGHCRGEEHRLTRPRTILNHFFHLLEIIFVQHSKTKRIARFSRDVSSLLPIRFVQN